MARGAHHKKRDIHPRKRSWGKMSLLCQIGHHIVCQDCNCCCHWDGVLVRYFEKQGRVNGVPMATVRNG